MLRSVPHSWHGGETLHSEPPLLTIQLSNVPTVCWILVPVASTHSTLVFRAVNNSHSVVSVLRVIEDVSAFETARKVVDGILG